MTPTNERSKEAIAADLERRHYQPSGKTTLCGARARVFEDIAAGRVTDTWAVMKIPTTTDVRLVECPLCGRLISTIVEKWSHE